jgi:nucleoside-diphosphate-sugar epimerase
VISWITAVLGTAAFDDASKQTGFAIVDVRDLVDRAGNLPSTVLEKVEEAIRLLRAGEKVVICCDYGLSRSNAVAAGVLANLLNVPFRRAVSEVVARTGQAAISVGVLSAVRQAVEGREPGSSKLPDPARRRIVVTGSTGFIGSHLIERLERRHFVVCPPRESLDLLQGALELDFLVKEHDADLVVHLANPRVYSTTAALGQSLVMLEHVLDVCRENALRLVTLSSWEVYSGHRETLLASEGTPLLPRGVYGRSKALCETLVDMHARAHGLDYAVLRAGPAYGPNGDKPKFFYNFLEKAVRGDLIVTHRYENGLPHLDLTHVDDVASAVEAVVDSTVCGFLNVGTGVRTSTAQIAELICDLTGSRSKIAQRAIAGTAPDVAIDASRAGELLGWHPKIALRDGVERLVKARMVELGAGERVRPS